MKSTENDFLNSSPSDQNTKNKRDVSVELLRIIASFIVVGTHIKLTSYILESGEVDRSVLFISSFFGEGVTIFFLILGFFYFNNKSTIKLFKHTFLNVILPAGVYILIAQLFYYWVVGQKTLLASVLSPDIEWQYIFGNILQWKSAQIRLSPHLWFLFTYVQCIMWFPLLRFLGGAENIARRYIIALALIRFILIDVQKVVELPLGPVGFSVVSEPILIVLLGYELYRKKEYIKNNKIIRICGLCLYFVLHICAYLVGIFFLENGSAQSMGWNSLLAICEAMALATFVLSFEFQNLYVQKIIVFIGKNTFYIYLVHWIVMTKLNSVKVWILNNSLSFANNGFGELLYTLIFSTVVYLISLIIAIFINFVIKKSYDLHGRLIKIKYPVTGRTTKGK